MNPAADLLPPSACGEAVNWVRNTPGTPGDLWRICARADHMLWLAGRLEIDRKVLVAAACDCAESVPNHLEIPAAVECIRVLRLWIDDMATMGNVRAATAAWANTYATKAAYTAAEAAYATKAAYTAAEAAYTPRAAIAAAEAAGYAAAYTYAKATVTAAEARSKHLAKMADMVRAQIPWALIAEKLEVEHE